MSYFKNETPIVDTTIAIECDPAPIRHLAIKCPKCSSWFSRFDILEDNVTYEYELYHAEAHCPICEYDFRIGHTIEEDATFPEFYEKCKTKKVTWE